LKADRAIQTPFVAGGEVGRFHDRYDFAVRVEFENGRPVARVERLASRRRRRTRFSMTADRRSNVIPDFRVH
jgi:hypothetical protein